MKNIISTFTGQSFNVLTPDPLTVKIEDIAHALSLLCRANGHFNRFYSVAEHSINAVKKPLHEDTIKRFSFVVFFTMLPKRICAIFLVPLKDKHIWKTKTDWKKLF